MAILSAAMDFLIYGRSALNAGSDSDTPHLDDAHWSYMDTFANRMTARGPTLSADRQTWTGSLHVVDLPNVEAAQAFAWNDPYHRAGLFAEHLIRHFDNRLGRAMRDRDAVRSLIADEAAILGGCTPPQIHAWEFGGRR